MTDSPTPPGAEEAARRELAALRAEVARLREALREADRRETRDRQSLTAERLRHEGEKAVSEGRIAEARIEAASAWDKAAAVASDLGRLVADGLARLRVSQATVVSVERANAALAAGQAVIAARAAELRRIVDGAVGLAILATDVDGQVLFWNLGAERMLALDPDRTGPLFLAEAVPFEEAPDGSVGQAVAAALRGERVSAEAWPVHRDGGLLWLGVEAMPLAEEGAAPAGVLWLLRDRTGAHAAERALRESETRLATVFEALPVGVGVVDRHGILVRQNQEMRQFLPTGAIPSRDPSRADRWRAWNQDGTRVAPRNYPAARALRGERNLHNLEFLYTADDGEEVWTRVAAAPLRGDQGGITGAVVVISNIDALKRSEERFRSFAENSADVLWITNGDGTRLDYLSPAFERVFGESRGPILASLGRFAELVHPEDWAAMPAFLPRVLAGESAIAHYRVVRPCDGRVAYLRDTGFPIRDAAGAVIRAAGITQDVTDLHEVAEKLEAEKERFRTLAEGIPELVWRAARLGHWTWASPQWQAYTGQAGDCSSGRGWLDAVHPADRAAAEAAWEEAEVLGLYQADFRLRHGASGRYAWFQTRGVPLRDAGGALVEWIGACTNIDDQVQAREALARSAEELDARVQERTAELLAAEATLRQAQKMEAIGQLTGGIAHDFNNMLQGVIGGLDMARRRLAEGRTAEVARYTNAARDAAVRAAGLTRRLLAFARRQLLQPRPLDPDALVGGMEDLLRRVVGPAVTVEFRLRDGAGHVLCDPGELESAVLNLCINARDAMPGGGRLTVSTEDLHLSAADTAPYPEVAPGDFVSIRVIDTGTGMSPEVLEHVLEPFFTTKPPGQGTGLGLSQVYGFARQSGGLLRIDSTPGLGTTVQILLPRREAGADQAAAAAEGPARDAGDGATILLVDDERAVRIPAAERLRDLGYHVVEAEDGPEAVRLLDGGLRPDILVTDVGLPNGMDGRAVAEEARRRWPGLPVVFATGYAHVALPDEAVVVTKPFDLNALAARIGKARHRDG